MRSFLSLCCFTCIALAACHWEQVDPVELVEQGIGYYDSGCSDSALTCFRTAIQEANGLHLAHFYTGLIFLDGHELDSAQVHFRDALNVSSDSANYYLFYGITLGAMGQHKAAIAQFDSALILDPRNKFAYFKRAFTYKHLGQHWRAVEDYSCALEIDSNYQEAYFQRGTAFLALQEIRACCKDFLKARKMGDRRIHPTIIASCNTFKYKNRGAVAGMDTLPDSTFTLTMPLDLADSLVLDTINEPDLSIEELPQDAETDTVE